MTDLPQDEGEVSERRIADNTPTGPKAPTATAPAQPKASTPDANSTPISSSRDFRNTNLPGRRDIPMRDNTPKASPQPHNQTLASGREGSRNQSNNLLPDSRGHNLPARPEGPIPPQRPIDRFEGRDLRMPDQTRDHPRDFNEPRRWMPDSGPRGPDRNADRRDHPRWGSEMGQDLRDPYWNEQGRPMNGTRTPGRADERMPRDSTMPPPRATGLHPDRAPMVNGPEPVHPARAALITGGREEYPRQHRDDLRDTRDRSNSRPQSPRRGGDRSGDRGPPNPNMIDSRRDDRTLSGRSTPMDVHPSRARHDEPPSGPRAGQNERSRDSSAFQPSHLPPRPTDPDHGRLNNPSSRNQSDANFGRLNPVPAPPQDIPSGPRGRGGRNPRISTGSRVEQGPPTPELSGPPTGPASGRHHRRLNSGQVDSQQSNAPPSTPSTPATAPGVHPDRAKHLPSSGAPSPLGPGTPGIHPDRARHLPQDHISTRSPAVQNNSSSNNPPTPTSGPPSGPRGGANTSGPAPPSANVGTPTGPGADRSRGGRSGRQLVAGINNMLQNPNSGVNSINIRGRSDRERNNSAPSTPIPQARPEPPRQKDNIDPNRTDLINPSRADLINPARVDLITGGRGGDDSPRDRDNVDRDRRSGRRSGREERSRSPGREPRRADDERSGRSRGDRRGGRDGDRDGRRSTRDSTGGRESLGGGRERGDVREPMNGREREDRRDGRPPKEGREPRGEEENWERGRRNDIRAEERHGRRESREDGSSGRKRRGEDAGPDRVVDKRPRR
jgi:THO complex subunit 2